VTRKASYFSEKDLLGFASRQGVHPGIVQYEKEHDGVPAAPRTVVEWAMQEGLLVPHPVDPAPSCQQATICYYERMSVLEDTPYALSSEAGLMEGIKPLDERVKLLRSQGRITPQTLQEYYGSTRFDQVAESNALEGSTLDVGETRLAVLKGNTVLSHDERYVRDAKALYEALQRMEALASAAKSVDIDDARQLHELILVGGKGAGIFRSEPVTIVGSRHRPPRTWDGVMSAMEAWEQWSTQNAGASSLLRAIVLHAWFTHVHPYVDGNGRTARALGNLELIRGGFPPTIIRNTRHRQRYIDALQMSDDGDIHDFAELMISRADDAIRDLERAAERKQGYSALVARERVAYERRLEMWNLAVRFLSGAIRTKLEESIESPDFKLVWRDYDELELDDFMELSKGQRGGAGWAFRVTLTGPGTRAIDLLAWAAALGDTLKDELGDDSNRPALRWSVKDVAGRVPWRRASAAESPYAVRMTFQRDEWVILTEGGVVRAKPMELAEYIATAIVDRAVPNATL
jgi:Fic family protein